MQWTKLQSWCLYNLAHRRYHRFWYGNRFHTEASETSKKSSVIHNDNNKSKIPGIDLSLDIQLERNRDIEIGFTTHY